MSKGSKRTWIYEQHLHGGTLGYQGPPQYTTATIRIVNSIISAIPSEVRHNSRSGLCWVTFSVYCIALASRCVSNYHNRISHSHKIHTVFVLTFNV